MRDWGKRTAGRFKRAWLVKGIRRIGRIRSETQYIELGRGRSVGGDKKEEKGGASYGGFLIDVEEKTD